MDYTKYRLAYNGGSMTTQGAKDFCLKVNDIIEGADIEPYTPSKNKKINDKTTLGNKDIARMIVAKDSEAIINSDVRVFNAELSPGTLIESGQVLGMYDMSNIIYKTIETLKEENHSSDYILNAIQTICGYEMSKDFILYDTDIRYHEEPETGYRRSSFKHQYQRGLGMKLMGNDDGYIRFETLQNTLDKLLKTKTQIYSISMDDEGNIEEVNTIFRGEVEQ